MGPPANYTSIADSGATAHFVTVNAPVTNKKIAVVPLAIYNPNGAIMYSTHTAEIDVPHLPRSARLCHIVPGLSTFSLISIGQLCDADCEVLFLTDTVSIGYKNTVIMQGARSRTSGLWHLDLSHPSSLHRSPPITMSSLLPGNGRDLEVPRSSARLNRRVTNFHQSPPITMSSLLPGNGRDLEVPRASARLNRRITGPTAPQLHTCLAAIGSATPQALVAFSHAALFSPALSTLVTALTKGFLPQMPGLTLTTLRKYPPQSVATVKGHLDQIRKNIRSTKPTKPVHVPDQAEAPDEHTGCFPNSEVDNPTTHYCYAAVISPQPTGQIHSDQTGRFPVASSTGNNYLLLVYDYDSNGILAQPMPNRTGSCILHAYRTIHTRLTAAGLRPKLQRLDNEASLMLKEYMTEEGIDYQLVPPGVHRRNAAERAIRTFKNHFIAGLCSTDKNFPLHLWDHLVPQAELTLNMLRGSRLNPKVSALTQLNGHFDFNRTPIVPPGIRVLAHVKSANRTTWSPHAEDGWYIGPAMESYRCYRIWLWDSRSTRICDTITWFPTKIVMPLASTADLVLAGITDIQQALLKPPPGFHLPPTHVSALKQLTEVLTAIPLSSPEHIAPLRVGDHHPIASTIEVTAPPLRVETPPTVLPSPPIAIPKVHFAPAPSDTMQPTYHNSTGIQGTQRRRTQRANPRQPLSTSATLHPRRSTRRPPAPASTHTYNTRSKSKASTPHVAFTRGSHPPAYALLGNAINPDTGTIAEYKELSQCSEGPLWQASNAEEIGRLTQGFGEQQGTNTMFFIPHTSIPKNKKPTYLRVVSAYRPEKANPRRIRWTVGGDRIFYAADVSTKAADLTTAKILLNSVISTPGAKFLGIDIKDFYLGTLMTQYEYMRIPLQMLPPAIVEQYNLTPLIHNNCVYVEIRKGMYGLPQAGKLANNQLIAALAPFGYHPVPLTAGLWRHDTRDITFCLVVDDFGVKYTNKEDADHLLTSLQACNYKLSTDWSGSRYCGLTIQWDYDNRTCDISMPGYVTRALKRFLHPAPAQPELSPHPWERPNYGNKTQLTPVLDTSALLSSTDKLRLQEVLGTLLYYARALDVTILTAISELATEMATGTVKTMEKLTQLLNYLSTNPEAIIRFYPSSMQLAIESDASYLSVSKARSRAAGYYYLASTPNLQHSRPYNGPIHVYCCVLKEVLASAAEAELGALFHNCKEACPLRTALTEMGHPQSSTTIVTDNSTAAGIANATVKQRRSKAIDMRFYWVRDRVAQGQFTVVWKKGKRNLADYFTKHHPKSHHAAIRSTYLHHDANPAQNYFQLLADAEENAPS